MEMIIYFNNGRTEHGSGSDRYAKPLLKITQKMNQFIALKFTLSTTKVMQRKMKK
jgi:hypothetical protein